MPLLAPLLPFVADILRYEILFREKEGWMVGCEMGIKSEYCKTKVEDGKVKMI